MLYFIFNESFLLSFTYVMQNREFSYSKEDLSNINVMLNSKDVSEYLKISPDGLEVRFLWRSIWWMTYNDKKSQYGYKWNTKYQPNQGRGKQNSVQSLCSVWYFNYFYIKDCYGGLIIWWGQNDATMLIASTFGLMFTPNLAEILCKEKQSCICNFGNTILIFKMSYSCS